MKRLYYEEMVEVQKVAAETDSRMSAPAEDDPCSGRHMQDSDKKRFRLQGLVADLAVLSLFSVEVEAGDEAGDDSAVI